MFRPGVQTEISCNWPRTVQMHRIRGRRESPETALAPSSLTVAGGHEGLVRFCDFQGF